MLALPVFITAYYSSCLHDTRTCTCTHTHTHTHTHTINCRSHSLFSFLSSPPLLVADSDIGCVSARRESTQRTPMTSICRAVSSSLFILNRSAASPPLPTHHHPPKDGRFRRACLSSPWYLHPSSSGARSILLLLHVAVPVPLTAAVTTHLGSSFSLKQLLLDMHLHNCLMVFSSCCDTLTLFCSSVRQGT